MKWNPDLLEKFLTNKMEVTDNTLDISTDHYPIMFQLPLIEENGINEQRVFRKTKDINMVHLRLDFQEMCENIDFSTDTDFVSNYNSFESSSQKLIEKHAPLITKNVRGQSTTPWVDTEFKQSRTLRRKYERKWRRNKTEENRKKYVEQRKLCAEMSITKQQLYYTNLVDASANNQKSLFKIVDRLLDKTKERVLPSHTDSLKLANEFNDYYIEKIENIRKTIPLNNENIENIQKTFEGIEMNSLEPVTEEEVKGIIAEYGIKTSMEDPIPADVLKSIIDQALPCLTKLINKSLTGGSMEGVKQSVINPLLKKSGLDFDTKNNYRPVNNLVFFSKLIERVVQKRLDVHMAINNLESETQFAYKKNHSTETMMLGIVNDILLGFDDNKCTIILFLDLSAAFDTIDINKLLYILSNDIGVTGIALKWFESYLKGRTQRVKIKNSYSNSREVFNGVPQGSVLGPKLFSIYVRSQPEVFNKCGFKSSSFADDANGMKTFSLTFQYNILKNDVVKCMENVIKWMNTHFLKVNPDKTELLLLYPSSLQNEVIIKGTIFKQYCIRFSDNVKNVGVWLDKNLTLDKHINNIVSHCYKLLKDIRTIRNVLTTKHAEMLIHAVITSRLDYCNSLFFNISKLNLYKLQKVQNSAARLIMKKNRRHPSSGILKELHWLRVESRIVFKILLLVYKCIRGICSNNLSITYKYHNYRPDDFLLLQTKNVKTKYGKRTFEYCGPRLWNALPLNVRAEENLETFKRHVKTILFEDTEGFKRKAFKYT